MAWLAPGLTLVVGGLIVWIATRESRVARFVGSAAVLTFVLILILGPYVEETRISTSVIGGIVIVTQATVLGLLTLWIASRESRIGRVLGGVLLAMMSLALAYGIIFGPMWKANALIIATILLTWILGRQRRIPARAVF
jgi:hypothetical protein